MNKLLEQVDIEQDSLIEETFEIAVEQCENPDDIPHEVIRILSESLSLCHAFIHNSGYTEDFDEFLNEYMVEYNLNIEK